MPDVIAGIAPAAQASADMAQSAVVTPSTGPPSQEPPGPIVVQNAAVGLGATVATNMLTSGLGGAPEIVVAAAFLNGVAQAIKQEKWFNEKRMTWFLLALGIGAMFWYYRDPLHWDLLHFWMPGYLELPSKGLLNGGAAAFQSLANFHGLAATGASPLPPVTFERSMEGAAWRAQAVGASAPGLTGIERMRGG